MPPRRSGSSKFTGGLYTFKNYLNTAHAINSPETFDIDYTSYRYGYYVLAIDVSADMSTGCDYDNPEEYGSLRISIDYKDALTEAITVFCVGEVQETLVIDGNRNPRFE